MVDGAVSACEMHSICIQKDNFKLIESESISCPRLLLVLRDLAHNARGSGVPSLFGTSAHGTRIDLEDDMWSDCVQVIYRELMSVRSEELGVQDVESMMTYLEQCSRLAFCGETFSSCVCTSGDCM